jgi:hypothetical protein
MEELKKMVKDMSAKQKIEIIAILAVVIILIIAVVLGVRATEKSKMNKATLEGIKKENKELLKSNTRLLETVDLLFVGIQRRAAYDSQQMVRIEANTATIERLNQNISTLKKAYANIPNYNNYNSDSLRAYFRREGARN